MKKIFALFLAMTIICSLCACGSTTFEVKTNNTISNTNYDVAVTVDNFNEQEIEAQLQGTWKYHGESDGFNEIFRFKNGVCEYTTYVDLAPGNNHITYADYSIKDEYIELLFENGHTGIINYKLEGQNITLFLHIDSGADKGNTRVYEKQDGGLTVPSVSFDNSTDSQKANESSISVIPQTETRGMKNALWAAKNYLAVMPFSHKGLIEQLEFEGYSHSEAEYAADNCGANWKEQAVKAAEGYLDIMPFSRSELIEQLEFEGFTYEQAVYGVDRAY